MSRKPRTDWQMKRQLDEKVVEYASKNDFAYREPSEYHSQLASPRVLLSLWTGSGKYYIEKTDFRHTGVIERQGETGQLPTKKVELYKFLDDLFFAADMV